MRWPFGRIIDPLSGKSQLPAELASAPAPMLIVQELEYVSHVALEAHRHPFEKSPTKGMI